jgi:hypothetical protein
MRPLTPYLTLIGSETVEWAAFKEWKAESVIEALNDVKNFDSTDRYYNSKLLLLYIFREFVAGTGTTRVVINIVNPGFCYGSGLHREIPGLKGLVFGGVKRSIGRSTSIEARTLVDGAVVKGEESHGQYLGDCRVREFWGLFESLEAGPLQNRLWEEMRGQFGDVDGLDLERYERKH